MKTNTSRRLEFRHYDSYTGGGCRVYLYGNLLKGCSAGGCGYDREGTAMARWLMTEPELVERLKHKRANYGSGDRHAGLYGLRHWNEKTKKSQCQANKDCRTWVDGACGTCKEILRSIGCEVTYAGETKNSNFYIISWNSKQ